MSVFSDRRFTTRPGGMAPWPDVAFDRLCAALDLDERFSRWGRAFEATAGFTEPFDKLATAEGVRGMSEYLQFCTATAEAFERTRLAYNAEPLWWRLTCHLAQRFIVEGLSAIDAGMLPSAGGEPGRMLYAMVYAGLVPHARRLHQARGIAPAVTRASLGDLRRKLTAYCRKTGLFGMDNVRFPAVAFGGQLFELGRLQYIPTVFRDPFLVLRRESEIQLVALAGVPVRADGLFADADGLANPDAWVTTLDISDERIEGHSVEEHGSINERRRTFDRSRWAIAAQPGSPVLGVHIPEGDALTPGECSESFALAAAFFAKHFADRQMTVFTCHSWLMDPQLAEALPHSSNIVRFQQMFRRYPVVGADDRQMVEKVLLNDPDLTPRTRLQHIVQEYRRRGGVWRLAAAARLV